MVRDAIASDGTRCPYCMNSEIESVRGQPTAIPPGGRSSARPTTGSGRTSSSWAPSTCLPPTARPPRSCQRPKPERPASFALTKSIVRRITALTPITRAAKPDRSTRERIHPPPSPATSITSGSSSAPQSALIVVFIPRRRPGAGGLRERDSRTVHSLHPGEVHHEHESPRPGRVPDRQPPDHEHGHVDHARAAAPRHDGRLPGPLHLVRHPEDAHPRAARHRRRGVRRRRGGAQRRQETDRYPAHRISRRHRGADQDQRLLARTLAAVPDPACG